jgi:hypothetical protein
MVQVQLSEIESEFQVIATIAIQALDAGSLHKLADELDKINSAASGLTQLKAELDTMQPPLTATGEAA